MPWRTAKVAAAVREATPSLLRIPVMWRATVRWLMLSAAPPSEALGEELIAIGRSAARRR